MQKNKRIFSRLNPPTVIYRPQLFMSWSPRNSAKIECNCALSYWQPLGLFAEKIKECEQGCLSYNLQSSVVNIMFPSKQYKNGKWGGGGRGGAIMIWVIDWLTPTAFICEKSWVKHTRLKLPTVTYSHHSFVSCSPQNSAKMGGGCSYHDLWYLLRLHLFAKKSWGKHTRLK